MFQFPQNGNAETDLPRGIDISGQVIYILAKRILFRKREGAVMFTIETQQMDIIIENVHSEKAKDLFYHMLINYEIYKSTAEILDKIWRN